MRSALGVSVLVLLLSAQARADGVTEARMHYQRGTSHFAIGEFAEAALEYQAAYKARPDPALLYNAAQAHRLAGNNERALILYKNYLQLYAHEVNAEEVRIQIAKLKEAIAASEKAKTSPPTGTNEPKPMPVPVEAPPARVVVAAPIPQPVVPFPIIAAAPRETSRTKTIAGGVLGGVGIAALIGGIVSGVLAKRAGDDINGAAQAGQPFDPARESAGKTDQIVADVMYGIGAAAVVTGVVLIVVGRRHRAPQPRLGFNGASLQVRF
jgi:hypothetical protein